jgi:putative peptide zinc metalloprotease protein
MRIVVSFGIMFYLASVLNGALIIIAAIMGLAGVITWLLVPLGKFVHYLATSGELARVRSRAVLTTVGFLFLLSAFVGAIPFPDHVRAQGLIDPDNSPESAWTVNLTAQEPGFVKDIGSGWKVDPRFGLPVVQASSMVLRAQNVDLQNELQGLLAEKDRMHAKLRAAMSEDPGNAQAVRYVLDDLDEQIAAKRERLASLEIQAPVAGVLVAPRLEDAANLYLNKGDKIGEIVDLDLKHLIVRAEVPNEYSGPLEREDVRQAQIRVQGRPEVLLTGTVYKVVPAGQTELASPALGFAGGGQMAVKSDDKKGTKTQEAFFEVYIRDLKFARAQDAATALMSKQRVMVRFNIESRPLAQQAWTALRQMIQKRFSA